MPAKKPPTAREYAAALMAEGAALRHRWALLISGTARWTRLRAAEIATLRPPCEVIWIGRSAPPLPDVARVDPRRARDLLGREVPLPIVDLHDGLDPDALGAIVGTVPAGGLLVLPCPPVATWPDLALPDRARLAAPPYGPADVTGHFVRRFARLALESPGVSVLQEGEAPPPLPEPSRRVSDAPEPSRRVSDAREPSRRVSDAREPSRRVSDATAWVPGRTADPRRACAALLKLATGRRRRPLVLTSDRGRGKSAALGIAMGRLLAAAPAPGSEPRLVLVVGPRPVSVAPVFEHARRIAGVDPPGSGAPRWSMDAPGGRLEFVAPGRLMSRLPGADVVLVDEAAALPMALLEKILRAHPRIAFATTVHGYEGTGRGFALRFQGLLERYAPGWRSLQLETPIRWGEGDPLERFTFRALLLDAEPAPAGCLQGHTAASCLPRWVDRRALAEDEVALGELFGLLVAAHYRTSPSDLQRLLDAPNFRLQVLEAEGHVVAAALIAEEGGLEAELAGQIYEGRRRPQGHLLPETLVFHACLEAAAALRAWRVVRIAVLPAAQGRGLGSRLLAEVVAGARAAGCDYLGTAFGARARLLRFWQRGGLETVRLGARRGASSGAYSAIMVRSISAAAEAVLQPQRARFLRQLPRSLAVAHRDVDPALALALLRPTAPPAFDDVEWCQLAAASAPGGRSHELVADLAWRLVASTLGDPRVAAGLSPDQRAVLVLRVLQIRPWSEVAEVLSLQDVSAARRCLQGALRHLVQRAAGAPAKVLLARFD